jgi:formylglycine-generating enzyme required for sulfatase activity
MGEVWAATDVATQRAHALKFLRDRTGASPDSVRRFEREARAASAVRHPNVVAVHEVLALDDGTPVLVMDLLEGESLAQLLRREGPLSIETFARRMLPVVSALSAAHAVGIVHRDLKPENVFLARQPDGDVRVMVLDFGIAKLTSPEGEAASTGVLTNTGTLLGTPSYMSPEQVLGERDIDHRADVWALGVIFYEALTGERPTHAETVGKVLRTILTGAIPPIRRAAPALPDDLAALVTRMLASARDDRPSDLREVADVLQRHARLVVTAFAASGPPTLVSTASPRASRPPAPRQTVGLIAVAIGLLVLASAAAVTVRTKADRASGEPLTGDPASGRCPAGMVEIAGGTFLMGTDDGKDDERPPHAVTVRSFCLARTETTVDAYNACVARGACAPAARTVRWMGIPEQTLAAESQFCDAYELDLGRAPINCVSWTQAEGYCAADGGRLPSESEWEFAARNGERADRWPWGDAAVDPSRANLCDPTCAEAYGRVGITRTPLFDRSDGSWRVADVGSYPAGASRAGVLDLVGNVWEWTSSAFCPYPAGECPAKTKVFRGGGWATVLPLNARPTTRLDSNPEHRYADVGFRCAKDL